MLSIHRCVEHFCIEYSLLLPRLTFLPEKENKPWLSPVFPSCFPTLHAADNSSWAVFTYLPVQKNSSLLLPNQSVHKTRLWGLSWASFDQAVKIDKRTGSVRDPSLRVGEFQFWTGDFGWFLARWPENPDFPSGNRFTPDWLCLALFDRVLLAEHCKILFFG